MMLTMKTAQAPSIDAIGAVRHHHNDIADATTRTAANTVGSSVAVGRRAPHEHREPGQRDRGHETGVEEPRARERREPCVNDALPPGSASSHPQGIAASPLRGTSEQVVDGTVSIVEWT